MNEAYESAKAIKAALSHRVDAASAVLNQYPKGAMGLTPDAVRATAQWKADKAEFDVAFRASRDFNGKFSKMFKLEIRAERMAKYAALELLSISSAK